MRLTRPMLALTGAVAVLALSACGAGGDDEAKAPETATGSLEQLAAKAKCDPNMQTDADEIRQAICTTGKDKYILATFATDRGQAEWLSGAKDYGGYYLVGRKWVAVGQEKTVTYRVSYVTTEVGLPRVPAPAAGVEIVAKTDDLE
ncbi:hypothetical protein, partial [Streptomyces nigra]|uniref:hypothetical protein n=1 Tax=Streptomyces nigra TaxID=1827580 RepID=UPI00341FABF4